MRFLVMSLGTALKATSTIEEIKSEREAFAGRGERIRTSDSCVPNAVLYQAELHPEMENGSLLALALHHKRQKIQERLLVR